MTRYRLQPTREQETTLLRHCSHARYVWNLAVEQHAWRRPGRRSAPGYLEQSRQLTAARAGSSWLAGAARRCSSRRSGTSPGPRPASSPGPTAAPRGGRPAGDEGFRITGQRGQHWDVRCLNRNWGQVKIPKVGWVRFRWSRDVPADARSFRVTRDRAGRWHVAFAAVPDPVQGPGTAEVVGIDRGVKVSAALSTGEMLTAPGLSAREQARLRRLERKLAWAARGSNRRGRAKIAVARLRARERDRRKDWAEKTSTGIARRFDVIRVEDLNIGEA